VVVTTLILVYSNLEEDKFFLDKYFSYFNLLTKMGNKNDSYESLIDGTTELLMQQTGKKLVFISLCRYVEELQKYF
jgi:hypothetical protein